MNEDVAMKLALQELLGEASAMVPNPNGGKDIHIDQLRPPGSRTSKFQMRYYNNWLKTEDSSADSAFLQGTEDDDSAPPSTAQYAA